MMKTIIVGLLLLSSAALAENSVCVTGEMFDTEGTSTFVVPHFLNVTTGGDSHMDGLINQPWDINPNSILFWHFPYPPNLPDGQAVTIDYVQEGQDSDPAKQYCLRTTLVGRTQGDVWGTPNLDTGPLDIVQTIPNADGGQRQWLSGRSTPNTIRRASNLTLPCTHSGCDGLMVRGATRLLNAMAGCSNPTIFQNSIVKICVYWP